MCANSATYRPSTRWVSGTWPPEAHVDQQHSRKALPPAAVQTKTKRVSKAKTPTRSERVLALAQRTALAGRTRSYAQRVLMLLAGGFPVSTRELEDCYRMIAGLSEKDRHKMRAVALTWAKLNAPRGACGRERVHVLTSMILLTGARS
jgi:hypothetical protein